MEARGRLPGPLPPWQDADGSDRWVPADQSRTQVLDFCTHAWTHADATIQELSLDATGYVPWWPQPAASLFAVILHVLSDTTRHAGHADILREGLDGQTGVAAVQHRTDDVAARAARCRRIEAAARTAASIAVSDGGHG